MPVQPDDLRVVMRRWATGVTVVAAAGDDALFGMAVTSFTSVTLMPPQVLVCIEESARTHLAIVQSGAFGISVLSESQQEWSKRFGGQLDEDGDRFVDIPTRTLVTGSPILDGAIAYLDCKVVSDHPTSTHTIFIGLVEASGVGENAGRPLLYYSQGYRQLEGDP
jgi:flavin reductase (DIM6/NTAB) family NADH-FMN oxidoreductase RutF